MLECTLSPSPGPAWSNSSPVSVSLQMTSTSGNIATTLVTYGVGPAPTVQVTLTANPDSVNLIAQMTQNINNTAPSQSIALSLAPPGGFLLTPAAGSPAFTSSCSLTNSSTMLECTLTPNPGPTWSNSNPLSVRVQLTSASGLVGTALSTTTANTGPSPTVQVQINSGTGSVPSTAKDRKSVV